MKNTQFSRSVMAIVLGSALISGSVLAEDTLLNKAASTVDSTGAKIDSSMKKVDNYMSDSAVTAKVKSALLEEKSLKSTDISVETSNGVVTLSGFLNSQAEIETAVEIAGNVEGVKSVSDKLHVKDQKSQSVSEYAGDAATTSSVKAKLLADDIVPSRKIKVETTDGVVQLSGDVENKAQSERAESIAKAVNGVKSVKNDLNIKP
ncbi:BON domain protein [Yersinia pseudotuberculosis IP 32953]|uniref:Osmotically-inducible protein Y n=13 Tax=Pseudomonadati TaxID=3379134 RepID=Q66EW5_YERPS|nr:MULTISPECIES: molecular chaperone OsmY [Yersinia pseudotuberculosis complex]ABS46836.1 Osmotically induced periplasmic protein OsmY [Yersinia pseudotuberculosis IP 31758]AIN13928.1 osmotically-inducible protein Y [Yersinia pseudotuberculosis]AJJ07249.1 BON domain protein [Yersinia pseudotuberculosis]AJJ53361.1 BON domain protein [Yersinia pseudotuberculosis IP 32953]AJJ60663.1 BON domain protein [Yersinia pseudotuberculosis YPIII]